MRQGGGLRQVRAGFAPASGECEGARLEFAHLIFLRLSRKPFDLARHQLRVLSEKPDYVEPVVETVRIQPTLHSFLNDLIGLVESIQTNEGQGQVRAR